MADMHAYKVEVAREYGILEAVLLNYLEFWCTSNAANERNIHEGRAWTYNSAKAMSELFPEASAHQIRRALNHLEEAGLIVSGNFNKSAYDRTKWYALTDLGYSFYRPNEIHFTDSQNGSDTDGEPIPVHNQFGNQPTHKGDESANVSRETSKRFTPPTLEEIQDYCQEKGYEVDAEKFLAYYEMNGWVVGRSGKKMKSWKGAVAYWAKSQPPARWGKVGFRERPSTPPETIGSRNDKGVAALWGATLDNMTKGIPA